MFFTNNDGMSSYIYRAPMDGSSKRIVHITDDPIYDMVIDYKRECMVYNHRRRHFNS